METPLVASATSIGSVFAGSTFRVPAYQREYAWTTEEVLEFWEDLRGALEEDEYFLGLIVLTDDEDRKQVVDGQQRLLTTTLLAAALFHEAVNAGRRALADRLQADFLTAINYDTDEEVPRVVLTDASDNETLHLLVTTGQAPDRSATSQAAESISQNLLLAFDALRNALRQDLAPNVFRRLGAWADFLTNRLFVAVFVHPNPAAAYRVFEVVNTRGRDLTTADLLKNFVLSQTKPALRDETYLDWQAIAKPLNQIGPNALAQFIRHVVTLSAGHILPRDLFDYLANRRPSRSSRAPAPHAAQLVGLLQKSFPAYMQMIDPTLEGPNDLEWLKVFDSLNDLGVIVVRPLLLAMPDTDNPLTGMQEVLKLVLRRVVVGNLGTGNIERRFSEAARRVAAEKSWSAALRDLSDLNPTAQEFQDRVASRSYNRGTLDFLRRSEIQSSITPVSETTLHLVRPRQAAGWPGFLSDEFSYWGSTVGNTVLSSLHRRPNGSSTWQGFKTNLLPTCIDLDAELLRRNATWSSSQVAQRGAGIASRLRKIWYS